MSIRPATELGKAADRLMVRGPAAISDAELVALVINPSGRERNAVRVAEALLRDSGSISALLTAKPDQLVASEPVPTDRLGRLSAVLELARRAMAEELRAREVLTSPTAVKTFLQLHLAGRGREAFAVMFLDAQNRLITLEVLFEGTLTQTSVYPREIVARALALNSAAVILAHNHPSGTVQPSRADESLTHTLKAALTLVDIRVLDHVIVAPGASYSMAEHGLL